MTPLTLTALPFNYTFLLLETFYYLPILLVFLAVFNLQVSLPPLKNPQSDPSAAKIHYSPPRVNSDFPTSGSQGPTRISADDFRRPDRFNILLTTCSSILD